MSIRPLCIGSCFGMATWDHVRVTIRGIRGSSFSFIFVVIFQRFIDLLKKFQKKNHWSYSITNVQKFKPKCSWFPAPRFDKLCTVDIEKRWECSNNRIQPKSWILYQRQNLKCNQILESLVLSRFIFRFLYRSSVIIYI